MQTETIKPYHKTQKPKVLFRLYFSHTKIPLKYEQEYDQTIL